MFRLKKPSSVRLGTVCVVCACAVRVEYARRASREGRRAGASRRRAASPAPRGQRGGGSSGAWASSAGQVQRGCPRAALSRTHTCSVAWWPGMACERWLKLAVQRERGSARGVRGSRGAGGQAVYVVQVPCASALAALAVGWRRALCSSSWPSCASVAQRQSCVVQRHCGREAAGSCVMGGGRDHASLTFG